MLPDKVYMEETEMKHSGVMRGIGDVLRDFKVEKGTHKTRSSK